MRPHVAGRGALVGAVCGVGALLAHAVAAGGHVAGPTAVVVVLAGLGMGPVLVGRSTLPRIGAASLALQIGAHTAMAVTGMHGAAPSPTSVLAGLLDGGVVMLLGHLAAAVVSAVLARGADRALVALLAEWLHALAAPVCAADPLTGRTAPTAWPVRPPLRGSARRATAGPRAPPHLRRTSISSA